MKSVALPLSRPGASKSMFLTSSSPGVPIGSTVSVLPSATTSPCSSPSRDVAAAAMRKTIRPAWVKSVASFVYWWRSPYTKRVPSAVVASRTWNPLRRRTPPDVVGREAAVHRGAVGQDRIEERLGLGDADVADAAPQPGRPVERADDDRDDQHDQRGAEPRRAEDREHRQPVERVHHARSEERVVAGMQVLHRRRVVGRRADREVGDLADGHPDDREQGQEDDLEDGEVDRREQPPHPVPDPGGDVPARRSSGGRPGDLRARDGSGP